MARARRLEHLTIAWNGLEAAVALISGALAGSIALVGFGLDSVIESASAGILLCDLRRPYCYLFPALAERICALKTRGGISLQLTLIHRKHQCSSEVTSAAAGMAKLADAADLKSADPKGSWGFESPSRHHTKYNKSIYL